MRKSTLVSVLSLVTLLSTTAAWACSVPVFRYALERWPADYYVAVVFHRGPLTAQQKKIVELMSEDGLAGKKHANVYAVAVDVEKEVPEHLTKLWEQQKDKAKSFPWMVLLYPWQAGIPVPAWTGPLSEDAVKAVIDSPARQEIAKRLLDGDSAVWLLLESGDKKKDDAAYNLLKKQLAQLQKELAPPEIDPQDIAMGYFMGDPDSLKIRFSILRVSRTDPAEKMLVEMLLGTEPDLRDYKTEPMVFPVFGRGRVLFALVGKGINPDTITESAFILTGPCTCTIKEQNPGTDLVVAMDWDAKLEEQYEQAMAKLEKQTPDLAGLGALAAAEPVEAAEGKTASPAGAAASAGQTDASVQPSSDAAGKKQTEHGGSEQQATSGQAAQTKPAPASGASAEHAASAAAGHAARSQTTQGGTEAETAEEGGKAAEASEERPNKPGEVDVEATVPAATAGGGEPADDTAAESRMVRNLLIVAALGVLAVAVGSFWIVRKSGTAV